MKIETDGNVSGIGMEMGMIRMKKEILGCGVGDTGVAIYGRLLLCWI